jgi:hypothetical protein
MGRESKIVLSTLLLGNLLLTNVLSGTGDVFTEKVEGNENQEMVELIERNPGYITKRAYLNFGGRYYMPDLQHPVWEGKLNHKPLRGHDLPLKNLGNINRGADESGWVSIPVGDEVYYRAEYHLNDLKIPLNEWVDEVYDHYIQKGREKTEVSKGGEINKEKQTFREKSKIHIVYFPKEEFEIKWHPGSTLSGRSGSGYTKVPSEDRGRLVGIFNGTYHNGDATRKVNGETRYPGMMIDGKMKHSPIGELSTMGFYKDGSMSLGLFTELPKEDMITMRQNEYLSLHNGELHEYGAYPRSWKRYVDDVLRSYWATTSEGDFAYIWTTYTPPAVSAKVLRKMNFENVGLIDIHPVIGSIMADPRIEEEVSFTKENSYHFVPDERQVAKWSGKIGSTLRRKPIQWDHYIALSGLPKDFFAVYKKKD